MIQEKLLFFFFYGDENPIIGYELNDFVQLLHLDV